MNMHHQNPSEAPADMHNMHDMHDMHDIHDMHKMATSSDQSMPGMHNMGDMMKMYFHGGFEETILFSWWRTTTPAELAGSAVVCFFMAVACEVKW